MWLAVPVSERKQYDPGTVVCDFVSPPGSVSLEDPDRLTRTDRIHIVLPIDLTAKPKPRERSKGEKR